MLNIRLILLIGLVLPLLPASLGVVIPSPLQARNLAPNVLNDGPILDAKSHNSIEARADRGRGGTSRPSFLTTPIIPPRHARRTSRQLYAKQRPPPFIKKKPGSVWYTKLVSPDNNQLFPKGSPVVVLRQFSDNETWMAQLLPYSDSRDGPKLTDGDKFGYRFVDNQGEYRVNFLPVLSTSKEDIFLGQHLGCDMKAATVPILLLRFNTNGGYTRVNFAAPCEEMMEVDGVPAAQEEETKGQEETHNAMGEVVGGEEDRLSNAMENMSV